MAKSDLLHFETHQQAYAIFFKKRTYAITAEEQMALRSNDKNRRAEIVIDPALLESHKGARMLIKQLLPQASNITNNTLLVINLI